MLRKEAAPLRSVTNEPDLVELPAPRSAHYDETSPPIVHPSAHVHPGAHLSNGVRVGPGAVIGDEVELGTGVQVGANVALYGRLQVGRGTRFWSGAVIGAEPQDLSFRGVRSGVRIGAEVDVREHVTVHRSTAENGWTVIGDRTLLMASSHVAHDCRVGSNVVLAGGALLAGHVHVEPRAFISGNVVVHQFSRIGSLAMIGGNSRVNRDVLPFAMLVGDSQLKGLNVVGLRRADVPSDARAELRDAFRLLRSSGTFEAVTPDLDARLVTDAGRQLVAFLRADTRRGFCGF